MFCFYIMRNLTNIAQTDIVGVDFFHNLKLSRLVANSEDGYEELKARLSGEDSPNAGEETKCFADSSPTKTSLDPPPCRMREECPPLP